SPERGNNDDSVNPSQQSTDTIISSTLKDINSHSSAGNRAEHEDEDEDDRITLSHLLERKLKNVRADENKEARNSDDNEKKDDVGDKNEDEDNDGNDEEEDRDKDATNKKKKDDDDDDDDGGTTEAPKDPFGAKNKRTNPLATTLEGLSTDQKDDGVKSDKANHEDSSKAATADYVIYQRKKKDAKKVSFAEPEQTPHVASIGARQQERKTSRKVPASKVNKDVQDTSKVAGQESKDDEVPIKLSKAFQDVPNAPSFSLGEEEGGRRRQRTHYGDTSDDDTLETPLECRIYPNINIATANKFIASREAEHLYNHVCTWRTRDASLSPVIFDNGNIKATASEIATSIAPCRCFESLVIAIAAQVLSTAKGQERKKFLSTYDSQLIMAEGYLDSQRLLNLFNEDHRNFDYIMLPIYEPITERRKATDAHEGGHWFLVIVNFKDKQFDVVDSFRKPINAKLQDTSRKVKAKIVNLWNKVTSKREDGQVKDVWRFPIKYFEGFKQLNK
ncbi:hypothetical protein EJB05_19724, partial [Eragrostis curvula]